MEQLLKILEDNARLPIEDIATMLNKSPAEVAAMIDLARAQGIIKGYKTLVDWEKAGVNRVEAVIELNVSPKKSRGFDEIAATIAAFDEVESVLLMSGGYDLQLVIKGQTFQEIALFVAKRLSPLDDVLSTATHFVLRTYKKEGRLYQDDEIDERGGRRAGLQDPLGRAGSRHREPGARPYPVHLQRWLKGAAGRDQPLSGAAHGPAVRPHAADPGDGGRQRSH